MLTNNWTKVLLAGIALLSIFGNVAANQKLSADELVKYHQNLERDAGALSQCLQSPEMHDHNVRMLARREQTLHNLRKAHGIDVNSEVVKRNQDDANKWMAGNHEEHPGHSRDPQNIFDFRWGDPAKFHQGCALTPTSVYGPFWHERQPLRVDIRAGERGIYLRLAMQIIDVATCKPLPNVQVDIWEANSLGNYSATMDGYLRGWQPTSNQGTVDFDTNFPGHYVDRASHVHLAVRSPGEKRVVNFGQVYFDQNIRDEVERTDRYKVDDKQLTSNRDDDFIPIDSSSRHDPFAHWSRIGNSLEDGGLLAWITIGVNTTNYGIMQPPSGKRDWHLDG